MKKISLGIRLRLALLMVATVLATVFVVASFSFFNAQRTIEGLMTEQFKSVLYLKENQLLTFWDERTEDIDLFVQNKSLVSYLEIIEEASDSAQVSERQDLIELTKHIQSKHKEYFLDVSVISPQGEIIASSNLELLGKFKSGQNFFEQAKKEKIIQYFNYDLSLEQPVTYFAHPIRREESTELLGVLWTRVDLNSIDNIMQEDAGLGAHGETILVNNANYLLTRSKFEEGLEFKKLIHSEAMNSCLDHKNEGYLTFDDYRDEIVIGGYKYISDLDACLIAKIDQSQAFALVFDLRNMMGLLALGVLILSAFAVNLVIRSVSAPFSDLLKGIREFSDGNFDHKINIKGKNELVLLADTFNKMAQNVTDSRREIENKVKDQVGQIESQSSFLNDQRRAILNVLEDIDEEKEIATRERDSQKAILEGIGDGVFVVDKNRNLTLFNRACETISGFSAKEVLGKPYDEILVFKKEDSEEKETLFIEKVFETGQMKNMSNHTILIKKDGEKVSVADSAAPLKNKKGEVESCVVVFRDVSKERAIERMKNDFLSVAAHQLRTPLGSMRWNLEMILENDLGEIKGELKDVVSEIYISNKRLLKIVNDLLNVSRIDQRRVSDKPKLTDVSSLIKGVLKELKLMAEHQKVTLEFKKQSSNLPKVKLDEIRLHEVIINLMSNAIKYNQPKGKVVVTLGKKDEYLKIAIKDNGVGIPDKDQPKIFTKFFRAGNAADNATEGSGLGLFVVKAYVEAWGGKVSFTSKVGKGTTFSILIPLKPKNGILDANLKYQPHQSK